MMIEGKSKKVCERSRCSKDLWWMMLLRRWLGLSSAVAGASIRVSLSQSYNLMYTLHYLLPRVNFLAIQAVGPHTNSDEGSEILINLRRREAEAQ